MAHCTNACKKCQPTPHLPDQNFFLFIQILGVSEMGDEQKICRSLRIMHQIRANTIITNPSLRY